MYELAEVLVLSDASVVHQWQDRSLPGILAFRWSLVPRLLLRGSPVLVNYIKSGIATVRGPQFGPGEVVGRGRRVSGEKSALQARDLMESDLKKRGFHMS